MCKFMYDVDGCLVMSVQFDVGALVCFVAVMIKFTFHFLYLLGTWMLVVQAVFLHTSVWGESGRHM